ncbi:unnamed protein product [Prorocentrum cordatum]|uniref:Uncharacterized protein n=1 Tax=Prorocentrum cordatum TaxID=2364126 RepID=A0ABN9S9Z2_9DINO|nr:unnamed protein product [Polarella glacialis]
MNHIWVESWTLDQACLASGCAALGPARAQLDEALALLGEDSGQRALEVEEVDAVREASEVKARLELLEARVGRLRKAARAAKEAEEGDSDDDW